jgi:hypothetical protein
LVCVYNPDARHRPLFVHKQFFWKGLKICTDFLAFQLQYLIANFWCSLLITLEKAKEEAWAAVRASDVSVFFRIRGDSYLRLWYSTVIGWGSLPDKKILCRGIQRFF